MRDSHVSKYQMINLLLRRLRRFPHTVSVLLPALLVFGVRRLRRQRRLEGALDGANDVVDILLARLLLLRQGLPPELRALERGDRAASSSASSSRRTSAASAASASSAASRRT